MSRSSLPHPDYAERLRAAREASGRDLASLSAATGISENNLQDLEGDPSEVLTSLSLGDLAMLCRELGVAPCLLLQDSLDPVTPHISYESLMTAVRDEIEKRGITLEDFEEEAGWELGKALEDPEQAEHWCPDGLYDICQMVNLNWIQALPL
jgi:transcriptional regulator with XRE-family HTH domain